MNNIFLLYEITKKNFITIFCSFVLSVIIGLVLVFLINPTYKSEATLYAQDKISISEQNPTNLGSLASLSSISSFGVPKGKSARYKTQLSSRDFIINFINSNNLKPYIFANKNYNNKTGELFFDPEIYNSKTNKWEKTSSNKLGLPPSDMRSYETFTREFYQITETKENFINIVIFHISPKEAKNILDLLIKDFNRYVKEEEVRKANQIINFLSRYEDESLSLDAKESINGVLSSQYRILALTLATEDVAFVPIDPPFEEVKKVKPSGSIILVLVTAFIMGFTYLLLILNYHYKNKITLSVL